MIVLSNNIVLGTVNEAATHSHLGIFPKTITITITITIQPNKITYLHANLCEGIPISYKFVFK